MGVDSGPRESRDRPRCRYLSIPTLCREGPVAKEVAQTADRMGHSRRRRQRYERRIILFERFTDRARRVVVLAQEEARLLNHNYIGTEHILLGLIHEGEGVA